MRNCCRKGFRGNSSEQTVPLPSSHYSLYLGLLKSTSVEEGKNNVSKKAWKRSRSGPPRTALARSSPEATWGFSFFLAFPSPSCSLIYTLQIHIIYALQGIVYMTHPLILQSLLPTSLEGKQHLRPTGLGNPGYTVQIWNLSYKSCSSPSLIGANQPFWGYILFTVFNGERKIPPK